ncbi:MAG: DUF4873 domain-containing protein [Mycobacterium sp.]
MTADVLIVATDAPANNAWKAFRSSSFRCTAVSVTAVDGDVCAASFDAATNTWTVRLACGATHQGQVVIATQFPYPAADGLAPYLGVADHGVPNYFTLVNSEDVDERARYVAECVRLMVAADATRIEVRRSTQRVFSRASGSVAPRSGPRYWERMRRRIPTAFDMWSPEAGVFNEVYDGPAILSAVGDGLPVRVRLTGRLDPVDGRYHWQGMIFGDIADGIVTLKSVTVTIAGGSAAPARFGERTPWGLSVSGVGAPPFPLGEVELVV